MTGARRIGAEEHVRAMATNGKGTGMVGYNVQTVVAAEAHKRLTDVVGALAVALLLLTAPNLLQHLPTAALAAVVVASAIGLIEVTELIRIYRIQS